MGIIYKNSSIDFKDYPSLRTQAKDHLFIDHIISFLDDWYSEDDYIIQETSGTTGKQKEIVLSKKSMEVSAKLSTDYFGWKEGDTALLCLPVKYIAGKMMIVRAIVSGLDLHLVSPSTCPDWKDIARIDFLPMTPHQFIGVEDELYFKVSQVLLGGGAINSEILNKISRLKATDVYHGFGMTETYTHIGVRKLDGTQSKAPYEILPSISIQLTKEGCAIIEAPHFSSFVTRDVIDLEEKQFYWIGRADNVVNSGGIKLFPEEIEKTLLNQFDLDFFVGGKSDSLLGQKLIMVIESDVHVDYAFLKSKFQLLLEKYEQPKEVYLTSKMQKTETGKLKRQSMIAEIERNLSNYRLLID